MRLFLNHLPTEVCSDRKRMPCRSMACEIFSQYLTGIPTFKLLTDHKPLVPLLFTKSLDLAPMRCQHLLIRMMEFNPKLVYVPGKQLVMADEAKAHVDGIKALWSAKAKKQTAIAKATEHDLALCKVKVTSWADGHYIC